MHSSDNDERKDDCSDLNDSLVDVGWEPHWTSDEESSYDKEENDEESWTDVLRDLVLQEDGEDSDNDKLGWWWKDKFLSLLRYVWDPFLSEFCDFKEKKEKLLTRNQSTESTTIILNAIVSKLINRIMTLLGGIVHCDQRMVPCQS